MAAAFDTITAAFLTTGAVSSSDVRILFDGRFTSSSSPFFDEVDVGSIISSFSSSISSLALLLPSTILRFGLPFGLLLLLIMN